MPFARVYSAQNHALKAHVISVEIDISRGLHSFSIVGLPNKAVEESRDRVSAAIKNSGFKSPKQTNAKVTVSLAPANLRKEGPAFDLPIAVAYLLSSGHLSCDPEGKLFVGELSLDGKVRPVRGIFSVAEMAARKGIREIYTAKENASDAATIRGPLVFGLETLDELISHLSGTKALKPTEPTRRTVPETRHGITIDDIAGNDTAKRGLVIAIAGRHPIALFGPPGTGKSMLAKASQSMLPDLTTAESIEVSSIHSASGRAHHGLITRPPFRSPHHTSSHSSIIGSGSPPLPGEITLAHRGILFLDELLEFDRRTIECLRQPLEDKRVSISRAKGGAVFPADFMLIAAFNPCPCGNRGSRTARCICTATDRNRYDRKLSGPIIDRIDLWVEVAEVDHDALMTHSSSRDETSRARMLIERAHRTREKRTLQSNEADRANVSEEGREILLSYAKTRNISARSHKNILRVARTIADLEGSKNVEAPHVLEALQYRKRE